MLFVTGISSLSILFFVLNLLTTNIYFAYLFSSIHYVCMSWILSAFFQVIFVLTKENLTKESVSKRFRITYLIFLLSDSIHIFLNNIFHYSYRINPVYLENGDFYYWSVDYRPLFYIHLLFCYIIAITIIIELIFRSLKSAKFYKNRFITILFYFVLLLLTNSLYYAFDWDVDYSVAAFFVLTAALFNYLYFQLPKQSIDNMMLEVTGNISNGVACFDSKGECILMNNLAKRIFCEREVGNAFAENYHRNLLKKYEDFEYAIYEDKFVISGSDRLFNVSFYKQMDSKKRIITSYIKLEDKTDEINRFEHEKYNANHDKLTGYLNRGAFFAQCENVLRENTDKDYYLVATNIKDFKVLNDIFGMSFGDEVIKTQAKSMEALTNFCVVGRVSGDRFGILIEKKYFNLDYGLSDINQIQNLTKDMNYKLLIYFGVYEIANHYESISLMFDKAVMAMKNATSDSVKSIGFYTAELMDKLLYHRNVLSEFHSALSSGQFEMYLQPQIDIDGRCNGAEALVRWNHPTLGLLAPLSFIGILESSGYIYELDKYIWEKAVEKLSEWKSKGIDKYISINISARDFYYNDLVQVFSGLVRKYGVEPSKLNLEITETVLLKDVKFHRNVLSKLNEYGFKIEMDDFGTGYSSLNALRVLNVDVLKIDMGFLKKTDNLERSKIILASMISMAKRLGMTVVTEGVESEEQYEFLKGFGSDVFQGYYFSRPVTVSSFEQKYVERGE